MTDIDVLIKEKLVPLRKRILDALTEKHPQLFSLLNMHFSGKKYRIGFQVTANGNKAGDFTFITDGLHIAEVQSGVLSPEVQHPFGVIKPYAIIEKDALEKMLQDEQGFINEPFAMMQKYMPDVTIKFMR